MDACHMLWGRPWAFDVKCKHDSHLNTYAFKTNGVKVTLLPLDKKRLSEAKSENKSLIAVPNVEPEVNKIGGAHALVANRGIAAADITAAVVVSSRVVVAAAIQIQTLNKKQEPYSAPTVETKPVHNMGASWSDVKHDSALTIQKVIRGFLVRKSMKEIYPTITLIDEVEKKVRKKHFMALIVTDSKERLQVLEQLMGLKIQWDSISTVNSNMSICKKSLIRRVIALQEVVDTIAAIDSYNRHVSHCSYKYILVGSGYTCLEQLKVLEKSSDGFYLANMNLLLRGQGNSLRKKQSGHLSEFPIARLELDGNMLQEAHVAALITGLPPGRIPVKTYIIEGHENGIEEVYKMTLDELKDRGKIYLVFPITELSEQLPRLRAVSAEFESISHTFPDYKCGLLHRKLKSLDKEEALKQSRSGETHILLSTQVIKIGVDIPDASMMVVMNAERF